MRLIERWWAVWAALGLALVGWAPATQAATLTVTTNGDGAGTCVAASCTTLRAAITSASSGDTIVFAISGTITLGSTLTLSQSVTIDGTGQAIALDGNNAVRVLMVQSGVAAQLSNLTIQNGSAASIGGGGIFNSGTLAVGNCTLVGNTAASGGGIYNSGALSLANSAVSSNSAPGIGLGGGGGIYNSSVGTLTLDINTVVSGNTTADVGGGISNNGSLTLTSSLVSGNTAGGIGGGIFNNGTATIANSTLSGNSSSSNYGGGIGNQGNLTIDSSTLSGNSALIGGGGIYNFGAAAGATVINSTLSGNTSVGIFGVGIYNHFGTLGLFYSTIAGNNTSPIGGGLNTDAGAVTTATNTIIADGCSGTGSLNGTSSGNIDPGTSCGLTNGVNGNQVGVGTTTLHLGALQNNGGPTQTILPGAGSAAIDASSCVTGLFFDQRGVARPQGPRCDVGAVEARQYKLTLGVTGSGSASSTTLAIPATSNGISGCTSAGGTNCAAVYAESAQVTLAADPGWHFVSASGCGGVLSTTYTTAALSGDCTVNATFAQDATSTSLAALPSSSTYGQSVTFIATVSSSGTTVPTGIVKFTEGSTLLCASPLIIGATSATASCTINGLMAATHPITASYSGDAAASMATSSFVVSPAPLTITATNQSKLYGQALSLGTTAFAVSGTLYYRNTVTGVTLTSTGAAASAAGGNYPIVPSAAIGTGLSNYMISYNNGTLAVGKKSTTLTLAATPNQTAIGGPVTITATVTGDPPTGTVTFCDGTVTTGSSCPGRTLCATVALTPGVTSSTAVCSVTFTTAGSHTLSAFYAGDNNFTATATALAVVVAVDAPLVPAPMLDRWAVLLLCALLGAVVFVQLRKI
jgi:hypothetical protein